MCNINDITISRRRHHVIGGKMHPMDFFLEITQVFNARLTPNCLCLPIHPFNVLPVHTHAFICIRIGLGYP